MLPAVASISKCENSSVNIGRTTSAAIAEDNNNFPKDNQGKTDIILMLSIFVIINK